MQFARHIFSIILISSFGAVVFAGAPFITDDPVTLEEGHWELDFYATADKAKEATDIHAPAIELDYGTTNNLELHLVLPLASHLPRHGSNHTGYGDTEVGVKWRFIEESKDCPQMALYPLIKCPTGDKEKNLGNGRLWVKLPLWLQKSWGKWTVYGGGGYAINPAEGQKNFPFTGCVVQRELNDTFTLGGEAYYQGADKTGTDPTLILNAGGYLNFTKNFSFLFSAGHSVAGEQHLVSYLGLYWTW